MALTLLAALSGCVRGGPPVLVLDGVTIVDGTDGPPTPNGRILIRGTRIEAVGAAAVVPVPRRAQRLDVAGKWVVPGLIDLHVHAAPWSLSRFVAWGVTTVRDLHHDSAAASRLQELANLGGEIAPRVFAAGAALDGPSRTLVGAVEVADPSTARRAVDAHLLEGRDWIKVYTHVSLALLRPIADEASQLRLPIAAHLGLVDAVTAARLGVRTIEHLSGVVEATVSDPAPLFRAHRRVLEGWTAAERAWAGLSEGALGRTAEALATSGVFLVPTLVLHDTYARFADTAALAAELPPGAVPDSIRSSWKLSDFLRDAAWTAADFEAFRRARAKQAFLLRRFRAAGGVVGAGSDAGGPMIAPGAALHRELALLVEVGLTPGEALRAATSDAALVLGADSLGRLEPGRVADLVVLDADPLTDVRNLGRIARVILRGHALDPRGLKQSW